MKKKSIIVISLIIIISLTIILLHNNTSKENIEIDGVKLAISDGAGNNLSTIPNKGVYQVTVGCTNANGSWDYVNWQIVLADITGNVTCDLEFKSITTEYFNNYIMKLCNSTGTMATCSAATASSQGNGELVYENGIRYEGKDPNNYVWFNNELWRIIGVFDSTSHGRSGENLIKLIRAYSIGGYAWNGVADSPNDWPNSTLYRMLNGCYLYQKRGNETINLTGQSGLCSTYAVGYYNSTNGAYPGYSDFSKIGIESGYRSMIVEATWYLGGGGKDGYTTYDPDNVYRYERSAYALYDGRNASTTGKIGLMYVSDYGYSVLGSSCTRGSYNVINYASINLYERTSCGPRSWLYGKGDEWTISPSSSNNGSVFRLKYSGYADTLGAFYGSSTRPVLYISSSVYVVDGDGSLDDPYIINM